MSDRVEYYFRQRPTAEELNLGFELLERADRNLASDLGICGIVSGAAVTQHSPVPNLSVDITGHTRAYDRLGQRIDVPSAQTVDCTVDHHGMPIEVLTEGHERWTAVLLA